MERWPLSEEQFTLVRGTVDPEELESALGQQPGGAKKRK